MTTDQSQAARAGIARALIIAGLLVGVSLALKLLSPEYLSRELTLRLLGVTMGAVVTIYANDVPKTLSPLARMRCDPSAEQALRRFTGRTLSLGGAAYVVAWLIAPFEIANMLTVALLGASVLLVIARVGWIKARTRSARA